RPRFLLFESAGIALSTLPHCSRHGVMLPVTSSARRQRRHDARRYRRRNRRGQIRPRGVVMRDGSAAPATVRIIDRVVVRRQIDPRRLGWIDQRRATARRGLSENGQYVDLRGFQRCDLVAVLEEERAGYAELAAAG